MIQSIQKRSFLGILKMIEWDYRISLRVCFDISWMWLAISLFAPYLVMQAVNSGSSNANAGAMNTVGGIALITMGIQALVMTSKKSLESKFYFPTERKLYSLAQFMMMLYGSLFFTVMAVMFSLVELLIGTIMGKVLPNYIFMSYYEALNFITGIISLFFCLLLIGSSVYSCFMFIRKWLVQSLVILGGAFILPFVFSEVRSFYGDMLNAILCESNVLLYCLKLALIALVLHILAYIPLKNMEVTR